MKGVMGMEKILQWFNGYVYCVLREGDIERFFNLCKKHRVSLWNMNYIDDSWRFCIYLKDFMTIRHFVKKTKVKIRIQKKCGFYFLYNNLKHRKAFCIGMFLFIFIQIFLSTRIWKVEIFGNSYYTDEAIIKYLKNHEDISTGCLKNKVSTEDIEFKICNTFDGITWISTYIEGTSLILKIEEKIDIETAIIPSKENIYSNLNGKVISMVTRSGTPLVSVGDEVEIGDLLIEGKILMTNDSSEIIEERIVAADGDIWIQTQYEYYRLYPYSIESKKYNQSRFQTLIYAGDLIIQSNRQMQKHQSNDFLWITHYIPLTEFIVVSINEYKDYENILAIKSISNAEKEAEKELSELFHKLNEKGVQIIENNVKIIKYGDYIEAVGSLIVIEPVSSMNASISNTETIKNGESYEYNGNDN